MKFQVFLILRDLILATDLSLHGVILKVEIYWKFHDLLRKLRRCPTERKRCINIGKMWTLPCLQKTKRYFYSL